MKSSSATKDDNILGQETIKNIKKELLEREKQIVKDLNDISSQDSGDSRKHIVKFPEYGNKSDENAQEISEYTTNLATEKVLESALRDIKASLKRIESGSYGICKYCGNAIGKKRMMARPVASACIKCKTKLQQSS